MSDAQNKTSSSEAEGVSMTINAQYIKDLSFECPQGVAAFLPREKAPEVEIGVRVTAQTLQDSTHESVLEIKCQAKDDKGVIFLLELHYAGVVTVEGAQGSILEQVLLIECPRLLFPFVRSIVADITKDGGFSPIVLSPVNFAALYEQHLAAQKNASPSN